MHIVYAGEEAPLSYTKSLFLVGPSPRSLDVKSWRPAMINALGLAGYDGIVFSPERRQGVCDSYEHQVEWEKRHLEMADLILAWVPRSLDLPGFTTNTEFGKYVSSGKLRYGRPPESPKTKYLDWMYTDHGLGKPFEDMDVMAIAATEELGAGSERQGGERYKTVITSLFLPRFCGLKSGSRPNNDIKRTNLCSAAAMCLASFLIG